jgi:hypothetical protein
MSSFTRERFIELVGHELDDERRGIVTNLNEAPDWLIVEARRLEGQRVLLNMYLRHYLAWDQRVHLAGFIEDVVEGGEAVATWGRGAFVVPFPRKARELYEPGCKGGDEDACTDLAKLGSSP